MVENTIHLKVHWGDTDMAGIIFYPNYFKWFDIGSHALFNAVGLPPKQLMIEDGVGFPIVDVGCSFRKPLYYDDDIHVVTRVTEVRSKVFRMDHEVYRGDEMTGKGYELRGWVQFDAEGKLRAGEIPEEARKRLSENIELNLYNKNINELGEIGYDN